MSQWHLLRYSEQRSITDRGDLSWVTGHSDESGSVTYGIDESDDSASRSSGIGRSGI